MKRARKATRSLRSSRSSTSVLNLSSESIDGSTVGFDLLPPELISHIFLFLSPLEICSAAATCKDWYTISQSEFLWRRLHSIHCGGEKEVFQTWKTSCIEAWKRMQAAEIVENTSTSKDKLKRKGSFKKMLKKTFGKMFSSQKSSPSEYDALLDPFLAGDTYLISSFVPRSPVRIETEDTFLWAASRGYHVMLSKIFHKTPDIVLIQSREGKNALHFAAQNRNTYCCEVVLQMGCAVNSPVVRCRRATALHFAAENCDVETVRLLLSKKANPNAQKTDGTTPLFIASHLGCVDTVTELLKYGALPDIGRRDQTTPLYMASHFGRIDVVQTLLEAKADYSLARSSGATPLLGAAQEGKVEVVELLLKAKAEVDRRRQDGVTPLCLAARNGCTDVTRLLLKHGADPNARLASGYTVLHATTKAGREVDVKLLLEAGAFVNATRRDGSTPLHRAAKSGHAGVVSLLLQYKADPTILMNDGSSALDLAAMFQHTSCISLLNPNNVSQSGSPDSTIHDVPLKELSSPCFSSHSLYDSEEEAKNNDKESPAHPQNPKELTNIVNNARFQKRLRSISLNVGKRDSTQQPRVPRTQSERFSLQLDI